MTTVTRVGSLAPDFRAQAYHRGQFQEVSLSDYQGKWVCLFFYPMDFTRVCPTEIRGFSELHSQYKEAGCELIACSTDSEYSHKVWIESELKGVPFPVLSDKAHVISRDYAVLLEERGVALRGTFLIDPKGTLQWMMINALGVGRSVDEPLRVLKALQTRDACPAGWKPGEPTLA